MTTTRPLGRRSALFAILATGALLSGVVFAAGAGAGTTSAAPTLTSRQSVRSVSPRPPAAQSAKSSSRATAPGGPPPPDTLYDQYDNAGTIFSSSQNFESSSNSYDDELADDFVVPGGIGWNIETVEVAGEYFNGPGPATSVSGGGGPPGVLWLAKSSSHSWLPAALERPSERTGAKSASVPPRSCRLQRQRRRRRRRGGPPLPEWQTAHFFGPAGASVVSAPLPHALVTRTFLQRGTGQFKCLQRNGGAPNLSGRPDSSLRLLVSVGRRRA